MCTVGRHYYPSIHSLVTSHPTPEWITLVNRLFQTIQSIRSHMLVVLWWRFWFIWWLEFVLLVHQNNFAWWLANWWIMFLNRFHWINPSERTDSLQWVRLKGIVHFEIEIWYVSAYPKGIQDVGVFFSSVDPILMFLGQTVLVCQSYNGRYRSLSQWEGKRTCTEKFKLNNSPS